MVNVLTIQSPNADTAFTYHLLNWIVWAFSLNFLYG